MPKRITTDDLAPETLKEMRLIRRDARLILIVTILSGGLLGVALWAACLLRLRDWYRLTKRDPNLRILLADPQQTEVDIPRFKRSRVFLLIGLVASLAIVIAGITYAFRNPLGSGGRY